MATGSPKKTRSQRVANVELPPGLFGRVLARLRQGRVVLRIAICALVAIFLLVATFGWEPPFTYRTGYTPARDVVAQIDFEQADPSATDAARQEARARTPGVFEQDPETLVQLRAKLMNTLVNFAGVDALSDLDPDVWKDFEPPVEPSAEEPADESAEETDEETDEAIAEPSATTTADESAEESEDSEESAEGDIPQTSDQDREKKFRQFKEVLTGEGALDKFRTALKEALADLEERGLLKELPQDTEGNPEKINQEVLYVQAKGETGYPSEVNVSDVLGESAAVALQKSLGEKLPPEVAELVFIWLKPQLPENTLTFLRAETTLKQDAAAASDDLIQTKPYSKGSVLATAGVPLDTTSMELLRLEHETLRTQRSVLDMIQRSLAVYGMYAALFALCGGFAVYRVPRLTASLARLAGMLALVVVTVSLCTVLAPLEWQAELIPLLLFSMTVTIVYQQDLALLLSAAVILVVVVAIGAALPGVMIFFSATAAAIMMLQSVRNRTKLLMVGLAAGAVALLATLGAGAIEGQPFFPALLPSALLFGFWAVVAGALMTCLLPSLEHLCGVQTDLSLIELGDPAHPLLKELIRRAPGTYNHSITVASLAEAAAESIGARGLLVRVGAYFHDIGKMLKPGYFIENQGQGDNRHESLVPAMSTLVIIAHVKNGADLARQNHLPESIIDFIQQHHGTTLVEYFYRRANEQHEADPDGSEVDESSFRYPGPKPQTKEAGVLMLADAVESASRVLVEPTPSRIESLVDEITMKRLLDGQFEDCGLTLQEVHTIGESLVKSLTAVYHGRVKYPDQQTA